MAEARLVIPRLKVSETTLQYHKPKQGPPLFYKPRFQLSKETYQKTLGQLWLARTDPLMPAYPYLGNPNRFPEANHGLYGGVTIQSGNKISKGRNKGKTLRKWFPNVKVETMRSQALKKSLTLPVTTRVKRTITKCGGIDEYLLGNKPARIKELGLLGWKLRWHVMNSELGRQKFLEMRAKKNENASEHPFDKTFEEAWDDADTRQRLVAQQMSNWEKLREKDIRFVKHMQTRIAADKARTVKIKEIETLATVDPNILEISQLAIEEAPMTKSERLEAERKERVIAETEEGARKENTRTKDSQLAKAGSLNDLVAIVEGDDVGEINSEAGVSTNKKKTVG